MGHQDVLIQPASNAAAYPDDSNMPSVSGSTLTYYPNYPTNTVAQTQTLTTFNAPGGELDTTSANQIIENLDIIGAVVVKHPGVIVRKCRISGWDFFGVLSDVGAFTGTHLTIEDCVITSPNTGLGSTAITAVNFTMQRCSVTRSENGADVLTDVTIQDCYIHDLFNGAGDPHADGIQTSSGAGSNINNVTVRHNTILCRQASDSSDGTSCIINAIGSTSFTNCTYDDNVMAGGAFCLYGPQSTTGTNVRITNNKFATFYHAQAGTFGYWTDATDEAVVTGNQLGTFSGGISGPAGGVISGTWSGSPVP